MSKEFNGSPGIAISPTFLSSAALAVPATVNAASAVATKNVTRICLFPSFIESIQFFSDFGRRRADIPEIAWMPCGIVPFRGSCCKQHLIEVTELDVRLV